MKRGRKSAADMAVTSLFPGKRAPRQRAPRELTKAEARTWDKVVASQEMGWFSDANVALLVQYCRHVGTADRVAAQIQALEDQVIARSEAEGVTIAAMMLRLCDKFDRLSRAQERESKALMSLATKMRLSQQSTRTKHGKSAEGGKGRKFPWE